MKYLAQNPTTGITVIPVTMSGPPAEEQIGSIALWRENALAWGIVEHLRKGMSERIYYRVWDCVRFFGGMFKDFAFCSGLDAVKK